MPDYKVPDVGELFLLDGLRANLNTCFLRLFTAPSGLTDVMTEADVVECSFPGYAPIALDDWGPPDTVDGKARIVEQVRIFQAEDNPAQTALGYHVTQPDGTLVYIEKFPAPVTVNVSGQEVPVLPRFSLKSEM